jgi:hypothetical protein
MGESKKEVLRVQFDPSVKLEFHSAKIAQLRLLPGTR